MNKILRNISCKIIPIKYQWRIAHFIVENTFIYLWYIKRSEYGRICSILDDIIKKEIIK